MIINVGRSWGPKTIDDLDNMKRKRRFIILSSINSETIPNIYDLIFSAFIQYGVKDNYKTKVSVLNISETHGSIHSSKDRLRSVFFHTGICFESIDKIDKDSIISFNHVDYNISSTDLNSDKIDIDDTIMTSYTSHVDPLMRKNTGSMFCDIIVPTPNFYEEYDMVKLTQNETNHFDTCRQLTEYREEDDFTMFNNNVYKTSLGSLIDKHTTVLRIDYKIEYISSNVNSPSDQYFPSSMEDWYYEIACNVKMILETRGFCSGDIIFASNRGFNIHNVKSQLNLSQDEIRINYSLMLNDLEELGIQTEWADNIDVLIHIAYEKVHVKIVDVSGIYTSNSLGNKSDLTPDDMSVYISDNMYHPVGVSSSKF